MNHTRRIHFYTYNHNYTKSPSYHDKWNRRIIAPSPDSTRYATAPLLLSRERGPFKRIATNSSKAQSRGQKKNTQPSSAIRCRSTEKSHHARISFIAFIYTCTRIQAHCVLVIYERKKAAPANYSVSRHASQRASQLTSRPKCPLASKLYTEQQKKKGKKRFGSREGAKKVKEPKCTHRAALDFPYKESPDRLQRVITRARAESRRVRPKLCKYSSIIARFHTCIRTHREKSVKLADPPARAFRCGALRAIERGAGGGG